MRRFMFPEEEQSGPTHTRLNPHAPAPDFFPWTPSSSAGGRSEDELGAGDGRYETGNFPQGVQAQQACIGSDGGVEPGD